jgi:hypothetical protein
MPSSDSPAVRLYALPDPVHNDKAVAEDDAARATSGALSRVLDAGTTYERLIAALMREYGEQLERAAADVDAFLAAHRKRGLYAT